jgi:hypothetical protein
MDEFRASFAQLQNQFTLDLVRKQNKLDQDSPGIFTLYHPMFSPYAALSTGAQVFSTLCSGFQFSFLSEALGRGLESAAEASRPRTKIRWARSGAEWKWAGSRTQVWEMAPVTCAA